MVQLTERSVRVRFAPSPTGYLHIGGARTALLNYLFARHTGGKFILRIEDTDQTRLIDDSIDRLMAAMRWLGLDWDEGPDVDGGYGPYIQSERLALYQQWANHLVEQGKAYRCYCTPERLKQVNEEKKARKEQLGYDRHCRNLSAKEQAANAGKPYVIRFAMPLEGQVAVPDRVRGMITFDNATLNDAVLLKSDGFPTYHLAVVVDDHFMQVSHVMRSDEWIPSLGLHQNLYLAFGWDAPEWVHLPVILGPDGKKMSKRNPPKDEYGNPIPIMVHEYRELGYLPDALVNFLTNIGYNFGDNQEIFSVDETIARFTLDRINNTGARFPMSKLVWLNGEYIREKLSDEALAQYLREPLEQAGLTVNWDTLLKVVPLVRVRLKTLQEVVDMAGFFFHAEFRPPTREMLIPKKMDAPGTKAMLEAAYAVLKDMDGFSTDATHTAMAALVVELGLRNAQVFGGLRVAVTGQAISPPTFETMEVLGKDESLRRIALAVNILGSDEG